MAAGFADARCSCGACLVPHSPVSARGTASLPCSQALRGFPSRRSSLLPPARRLPLDTASFPDAVKRMLPQASADW